MAVCRACGAAVGREFRFCPQCAAPVGSEIELIDYGVAVGSASEIHRNGPDRRWALAAGGVALVVLALWVLGRLSGGDPQPAAPAPASSTVAPTGDPAGPTGVPSSSVPAVDTTITVPVSPGPSDPRPVLDHPTGLVLLVGSGSSLSSVDLDTGAVATYQQRGAPLLVTGGRLVYVRPTLGVWSLPLDQLDGAGTLITATEPLAVAPGPAEGQVWLLLPEESLTWHLFDVAGGELGTRPAPAVLSFDGSMAGPDLVTSPAGGVFVAQGERYRKVSAGQLLGVSDHFALVETCDQPNQCQARWLDRATWATVDRPLPDEFGSGMGAPPVWLSPDGRLLGYESGSGQVLFDVSQGRRLTVSGDLRSLSASPDAKVAAMVAGSSVMVYEVDTGRNHVAPGGLVGPGGPSDPIRSDQIRGLQDEARTLLVPRT